MSDGPDDPSLVTLPLFTDVSAEMLTCVTAEMYHTFMNDEVLFHQGEAADSLVVLLHGTVKIETDGIYIVSRSAYEVIGEQAFINSTSRSASAVAQGMVKALVLPRHVVDRLLEDPAFCKNLLKLVSLKLTEATVERAIRYRHEELLFSEFRAHVAPEVLQRLLATGMRYGDPRYIDAVILFSDIRSFTQRSAGMTPETIAEELSPYLDAIVEVIHRYKGFVDKFIGDAVMAIWGFAPSEEDMISQALDCAKEMILTASRMSFGDEPIAIGIGLNAGQVFIGNVGGAGKRQFTVLGTAVNLAARFESESKALGTEIVLGPAFYDRLSSEQQTGLVPHEGRHIKGAEPLTVYTCKPIHQDNN